MDRISLINHGSKYNFTLIKALKAISAYKVKIKSKKEVLKIKGIGSKIASLFENYFLEQEKNVKYIPYFPKLGSPAYSLMLTLMAFGPMKFKDVYYEAALYVSPRFPDIDVSDAEWYNATSELVENKMVETSIQQIKLTDLGSKIAKKV